MNYTYKIRRVDPATRFMSVIYSTEGLPDFYQNFSPQDFSEAALTAMIEDYALRVVEKWDAMRSPPTPGIPVDTENSGVAYPRRYSTPPAFDPRFETVQQEWIVDTDAGVQNQVWTVVPRSDEQIVAEARERDEQLLKSNESLRETVDLLTAKLLDRGVLTDEEAEKAPGLFSQWAPGLAATADDVLRFEGVLYKVLQAHTTAVQWIPPEAPSLFTLFRNPNAPPQPWTQPTAAQDAFGTGARVTHDNPNDGGNIWVYESAIDANTTEPGRDGTFDRYWTPIAVAG